MDWVGLAERIYYLAHARGDVVTALRGHLANVSPRTTILDFGGGDGRISVALARSVRATYTIADVDADALARVPEDPALIPALVPAAGPLPFPAGTFDHVIAIDVLHEVGDTARLLTEVARCLRPGGTLLVVDYDGRRWIARLFNSIGCSGRRRCTFLSPDALAAALERAGFEARVQSLDRLRILGAGRTPPARGS